MDTEFQFGMINKFRRWITVMTAQQCDHTWCQQTVHFKVAKMVKFILLCIFPQQEKYRFQITNKTTLPLTPLSLIFHNQSVHSVAHTFKICIKSTTTYHHHYHLSPYHLPLPIGYPSTSYHPNPIPRAGLANSGKGEVDSQTWQTKPTTHTLSLWRFSAWNRPYMEEGIHFNFKWSSNFNNYMASDNLIIPFFEQMVNEGLLKLYVCPENLHNCPEFHQTSRKK